MQHKKITVGFLLSLLLVGKLSADFSTLSLYVPLKATDFLTNGSKVISDLSMSASKLNMGDLSGLKKSNEMKMELLNQVIFLKKMTAFTYTSIQDSLKKANELRVQNIKSQILRENIKDSLDAKTSKPSIN